jgi:hypothetical protein
MATRHIVLAKVRAGVSERDIRDAFADLRALAGTIPGLRSFNWGPNTSPEGAAQGYTHGFTMEFDDAAARDAYLPHPLHKRGAEKFRAIREPGGVLVFDFDDSE